MKWKGVTIIVTPFYVEARSLFTLITDILLIIAVAVFTPRILKTRTNPKINTQTTSGVDELEEILQGDWTYKGVN